MEPAHDPGVPPYSFGCRGGDERAKEAELSGRVGAVRTKTDREVEQTRTSTLDDQPVGVAQEGPALAHPPVRAGHTTRETPAGHMLSDEA